MRITRLTLYALALDEWGGESRYGSQQILEPPLEANIVRLDTDEGLTGWGESCVPPPYYLPTLASGAREGIKYVAPLVVGADPHRPRQVMESIRASLRGHGPSKAAIDMALWDLCGKAHGLPLVDLWGGRVVEDMPVLAMVSIGSPDRVLEGIDAYRRDGYSIFQIKIGSNTPSEDIETITRVTETLLPGERCWFDVNRGWTVDEAMQVLPHVAHLAPLIEQPCETYRECCAVARRIGLGLMLDEVIDSQEAMIRASEDGVIDVAVLKMGCTGGISQHRHLAELGLRLGIPMRIEDYYGTGLTLAAVTHLAQGLPAKATFALYDYHMPEVPLALNPLPVRGGRVSLPPDCGPGLGVEINKTILGEPLAVFQS